MHAVIPDREATSSTKNTPLCQANVCPSGHALLQMEAMEAAGHGNPNPFNERGLGKLTASRIVKHTRYTVTGKSLVP